jgi:pyrroloquinoline-quinone synthase
VCSSLTELFAPTIHKQRLANWPEHYPWIEPEGLQYFRNRVTQARRDVEQGLRSPSPTSTPARSRSARWRSSSSSSTSCGR